MQKNLQNYFESSQKGSKTKECESQVLIEASPYIFLMIYQTRKKPGTRFWPFFKPEKPVLKDRPEMETLSPNKGKMSFHKLNQLYWFQKYQVWPFYTKIVDVYLVTALRNDLLYQGLIYLSSVPTQISIILV